MQVHKLFHLSDAIRKKLIKGKVVQIPFVSLSGGSDAIHLDADNFKRVIKAHRLHKGVRLALSELERHHNIHANDAFKKILTKAEHIKYGTGIGQDLKKSWNAVAKSANKTFSKHNMAVAGAVAKKIAVAVAPTVAGLAGSALATATGNPELAPIASKIATTAVSTGLKGSGMPTIQPIVRMKGAGRKPKSIAVAELPKQQYINLVGGSFVSSGY
jgi:hypothetical protein